MLSRSLHIIFGLILLALFSSCTVENLADDGGENIIGNKLKKISSLNNPDGEQSTKVILFDEKIRKIHQFDLDQMKHEKSLTVRNPKVSHSLLFHNQGRYIIDFAPQQIDIYDSNGNRQEDPIQFVGTPQSAAFNQDQGLLVVYDDLQSVGIVQLSPQGQVIKSKILGSAFGNLSIAAGDILDNGNLVLSLSDNSIVVVDLLATLNAPPAQWVYTSFSTDLERISWIAPIRGSSDLILARAQESEEIALINLQTQTVVERKSTANCRVEKMSKFSDPHMILRCAPPVVDNANYVIPTLPPEVAIHFVQGGALQSRTFYHQKRPILSSLLNLDTDKWTILETNFQYDFGLLNNANEFKLDRKVRRFRVSDMLALAEKKSPEKAQLELGAEHIFALFPSDLGLAARYDVESNEVEKIEAFNLKQYKK